MTAAVPSAARPRPGDLIVTAEGGALRHHAIAQFPNRPRIVLAFADDAIALASQLARARLVDVWQADEGERRRIASFRP